jgi:hypothetical protein
MKLVALMLFLSVTTVSQGQDFVFNAGFKVGGGVSRIIVDDDAADFSFGPSYQFGGFIDYSKTKVGYQLDIVYSIQNTSIKVDGDKREATLKYVNIPLAFKYYVKPGFNVQAGPQIGFLNCFHSDYHPVTHEPFEEQDYTTAYSKTDFSLNIGTGYSSPQGLFVDLRYNHGLKDISNYDGVMKTRNSSILFSVGYKLYQR